MTEPFTSTAMDAIVARVVADIAPHIGTGQVANYIPALARIDPNKFGLAVMTLDGHRFAYGDAEEPFSIQSISKVFTLTMALEREGGDLWQRVGREPSGTAFNSIVQLESERGIPRNPFINAGAITVTDTLVNAGTPMDAVTEIVDFVRRLAADTSIGVDRQVALSEEKTGDRNRALANFMAGFGNMKSPVNDALYAYFHQCALALSCSQLARAGLFLAHDGVDPLTGEKIISRERCRRINALMLACGHYDGSGEFAFQVGLPGKSGVGGGILAIAPGKAAVAVWSPGLNQRGNSLAGTFALERLTKRAGWSIFAAH